VMAVTNHELRRQRLSQQRCCVLLLLASRCRQQAPLKHWYLYTKLYVLISQNTRIFDCKLTSETCGTD
jgi:hypothetical protein